MNKLLNMDGSNNIDDALNEDVADALMNAPVVVTHDIDLWLDLNQEDWVSLLAPTMDDESVLANTIFYPEEAIQVVEEINVNDYNHQRPPPPDVIEVPENHYLNESCTYIVTPESSVCSERSSDGLSVSDHEESVHEYFNNLRYEVMENVNVIVLGSKIAKNPPGITKEYRLFKSDIMKKRQTVRKETLQQLVYPQFIEYLRSKGKCADATSIDDLCFFQKEKNESSYRRLLGDDRDCAIIKDIQVNNTGRNKARKTDGTSKLEKFISSEREQLERVPLEVDLDFKNLLNLMLDNMESIAPQSESTIKKFIQNYKRNYKWLIKQSTSKKRKCDNVHTLVKHSGDGDDDKEEMCGKKRRECGPVSIGKTGTNGTTKVTSKSEGPCSGWNTNLQLMPLPVDETELEFYATDISDVEDDAQSDMEYDSVDNCDGFLCNDELW